MSREIPINIQTPEVDLALKRKNTLLLLLATMRPHQWVKNLFIFAPLLFGKKLTDSTSVWHALLAFGVFSFLASGLYIFNDWMDSEEDRAHPVKRFRPISSGLLPARIALIAFGLLICSALWVAMFIGTKFFLVATLYFILTLVYCLILKKLIVLDGMTIAVGFVLRVVGGAIAVGVVASHWLIVCAFLLALFLAFAKRRQELLTLSEKAGEHRGVLKDYSVNYLGQVNNILIGAAIVCYALYTVAPETIEKFRTENLIYGTVFVIYGLFRYMALIENPEKGGNPSKMLLKDTPLILTIIGWALYNLIVIYDISIVEVWTRFS
jgi:4-hydroxybenzoate polyprenyltransferase